MRLILEHHQIAPDTLPHFLGSANGLAALALLCNAAAKVDSTFYSLKADLVALACIGAGRTHSWVDTHEGMPVYLIETGLVFESEPLQLPFHFRNGDRLPVLPHNWPEAHGRRWRGQQAQVRAAEIARDYLACRGIRV